MLGTPFVLWKMINEGQESHPDPAFPIQMLPDAFLWEDGPEAMRVTLQRKSK